MIPSDCRYKDTHEWAKPVEPSKAAGSAGDLFVVGITQHAADLLTDVTFIDLPTVGESFAAGGQMGEVESVKATSAIYAPIGGEVVEVNAALTHDPGLINREPQTNGWMVKMRASNPGDYDALMDAGAYQNHLVAQP